MIKLNTSALLGMAFLALVSCKNETKKTHTQETTQEAVTTTLSVTGNYVSSEYEKRDEGYDWVSVAVKAAKDEQLKIAVRSRADKKKPTCTFEALAKKVNDSTFSATAEGKTILFSFKDNQISITTQNESDSKIVTWMKAKGIYDERIKLANINLKAYMERQEVTERGKQRKRKREREKPEDDGHHD